MRERGATDPAARGRIIKKGTGLPLAQGPAVATDPTKAKGATAPPFDTGPRLRERAVTLLGIPLVFAASAGFMWSRPLEPQSAPMSMGVSVDHSRYHSIGQEMVARFSASIDGVVRQPEKRLEVPREAGTELLSTSRGSAALTEISSRPPPPKSAPQLEALEKQVYRILKRHGRPVQNGKELATAIVREALAQNYDPVFVAAVIKSESAFNSLARSHKGAQGLMQIMPKTGAWLADQQAIPRRKLTDPGHNLKLGISYLKQLEQEYGGNRVLTLVAYNWGPGHVASASKGGRRVPGEVMQYAVKILNDYRRWSSELRGSFG